MRNVSLGKHQLLIMRVLFFKILILLFSASIVCANSAAQEILNREVSLDVKNASLKSVLKKIESAVHIRFSYSSNVIDLSQKVTLVANAEPLYIVLDRLFIPISIQYEVINEQVLLYQAKKKKEPEVATTTTLNGRTLSNDDIDVRGQVLSSDNAKPLSGVSVSVKNTGMGTMTDDEGKFRIMVRDQTSVIVFSYVGYETKEIVVGDQTYLAVSINPQVKSGDEVIVVGYGAQSKRNVTGSISKVNMRQMENLPNTNVSQALRGRVAGVQFIDNARPGQGGSILIRGTRSLTGGNNPLIIVDGIQFNSSIADINPNDIESMEILKDASAAAIYGSRAANGVILITSKKGTSEKPTIRINAFQGVSDWSYKMKLLTPERYIQALLDWRQQSGLASDPAQIDKYLQASEAENYRSGRTIDAWDEIAQDGRIGLYDVSISGRSQATNYFLSGSFAKENGLIYNDDMKRISLRANIETKIASWLTVGLNSTFIKRDLSGREADLTQAFQTSPFGKLYYDDGEPTRFPVPEEQVVGNPMRMALLTENEEIYNNLFTNFYTTVNIPKIDGLSYRFNYSPNYRWRHAYNFVKQDKYLVSNTTSASKFNQENFDWVLENILSYKKRINENHYFDVTLLYGQNHTEFENTNANASPLANPTLGWNSLGLGEVQTVTSNAEETDGISSMVRVNYHLLSKYLFTFTMRRDGSSVFADNNKYANFPSAAVAWILSEEKFIRNVKFINSLKLRASYGSVGNQAIGPYQSLSLSGTTQYVFGDGGSTATGVFPVSIANPDLKWETTTTTNLALDFELLKSRLSGTIEVYDMNTKDLIVRRTLPIMTGYTSILTNLGATNNKGIEISLNTINFQTKKFEWSSNLVFSSNKNKIVHLYSSDTNGDGKEDDDIANKWFIGKPVFVAYDYVQDGIYQDGDVLPTGYKPGFVRLKDLDDNKTINAGDRTVIGQLEPKYRWGFTNNFRYGNLTLSVFINAMQGWIKSFNQLDFTGSALGNNYPGRAVNMMDAGWWTAENKSTTRPSLVYTNPYLHGYYLSRDFVRIQDVSLAYEFQKPILDKLKLKSLRAYVSAKNLHTFTDWIGPDPESGYNTQSEYYPTPRSVALGINVSF